MMQMPALRTVLLSRYNLIVAAMCAANLDQRGGKPKRFLPPTAGG